jgi:hypothetical protein
MIIAPLVLLSHSRFFHRSLFIALWKRLMISAPFFHRLSDDVNEFAPLVLDFFYIKKIIKRYKIIKE